MTKKKVPQRIMDSGFSDWTVDQLPDLTGKRYLITGGNSGIGFEAAKQLGGAGGDIQYANCSNCFRPFRDKTPTCSAPKFYQEILPNS